MNGRRSLVTTLLGLAALPAFTAGCTGATTVPSPVSPLPTAQALPPQTSSPVWPTPVAIDWEPELELARDLYGFALGEQTIALVRDGDLYLMEADSGKETRVTVSGNVTYVFGWSHDRAKLALGVGRYAIPESDGPVGTDLWVVDLGVGQPVKATAVTDGLKVAWAEWSPIDDRIAYGSTEATLHLVTKEGRIVALPTSERERAYLGTWSPDGTRLTYRSKDAPFGEMGLVLMDMMAGATTRVLAPAGEFTVGYAFSTDVVWSLDGDELLYRRDEYEGRRQPGLWLHLIEGGGSSPVELPEALADLSYFGFPQRSPVADVIALVGYGSPDVRRTVVMTLGGEVLEVMDVEGLAWSPDGQALAVRAADGSIRIQPMVGEARELLVQGAEQLRWAR